MDWIMATNQLLERARVVIWPKLRCSIRSSLPPHHGRSNRQTDGTLIDRQTGITSDRAPAGRPPSLKLGPVPNSSVFLSTPIRLAHALWKKFVCSFCTRMCIDRMKKQDDNSEFHFSCVNYFWKKR